MSTYRQRWKYHYTGTPASIAYHASLQAAATATQPAAPPSLVSRMNQAAWDAVFGRTDDERETALRTLADLVNEALAAGYMIDVTNNAGSLKRNSSKHCITLHVRKPGEPETIPPAPVFVRTVTRTTHEAIEPRIRAMFVSGEGARS
jgi:hypothetical protein